MNNKPYRSGVTLIEVVLCLVLLIFIGWFIFTVVASSIRCPPRNRLSANAGGIYKQIFAAATENTGGKTDFWAASQPDTEFANYQPTSTDYLRWLMTPYDPENPADGVGVVQQDFTAFLAPGFKPIRDLEDLTAEKNPWVVVSDLNETSTSGTPFLITRNVNEIRLKQWVNIQEPLRNVGVDPYVTPYGDEALIVVRVGGGAEVLNEKQFFWDILNPTSVTNRILQP